MVVLLKQLLLLIQLLLKLLIQLLLLLLATGPVLWSVAAGAGRIVGNDSVLVALLQQEHGRSGQPGNVEWMERNQASVDGKFQHQRKRVPTAMRCGVHRGFGFLRAIEVDNGGSGELPNFHARRFRNQNILLQQKRSKIGNSKKVQELAA